MRSIMLLICLLLGIMMPSISQVSSRKPDPLYVNGIRFDFVRIPAGEFNMGSNERPDEQPVHMVRVDSFDLGTTEVTIAQFRAFIQATSYRTDAEISGFSFACCWRPKLDITWRFPGFLQADNEPVVGISWNDAIAYCRWLSQETGEEYRLPSEAEWEYACQTGNKAFENELDSSAWYSKNSNGRTHAVATKRSNSLALYDMMGNAWEWTQDVYHENYAGAPADGEPWNSGGNAAQRGFLKPGEGRVLRGGSWGLSENMHPVSYDMRITSRPVFGRDNSCNNSGFRLARTIRSESVKSPTSTLDTLKLRASGIEFEFIRIPQGSFLMGAGSGDRTAMPVHEVVFAKPYFMSNTEVTVRQFRAFVTETGYITEAEKSGLCWDSDFRSHHSSSKVPGLDWQNPGFRQSEDNPVTCISWNDAIAFCKWLSEKTGHYIRLPGEAEWEYACCFGNGEHDIINYPETAWYFENSGFATHEVAQKKASSLGLFDMMGNVSEWTMDVWHNDYTEAPSDGSPWLGSPVTARVVRGGSFERETGEMGPRARDWYEESEAVVGAGFRIMLKY